MENKKRLIDANEVFEQIRHLSVTVTGLRSEKGVLNEFAKHYRESVLRIVDEAPTVDAVEVVHGHWTTLYKVDTWMGTSTIDCFICSECGVSSKCKGNYCPNCGAKMDGGKDNGQA